MMNVNDLGEEKGKEGKGEEIKRSWILIKNYSQEKGVNSNEKIPWQYGVWHLAGRSKKKDGGVRICMRCKRAFQFLPGCKVVMVGEGKGV